MSLQQIIQDDTKKLNELFDKLEGTSDNAVKTRENVYGELSRELRLLADVEQQDLLPALRKNDETKELAKESAGNHAELRTKLDELDALPKNDASFRERIGALRQVFNQQVRAARAGQKALTPEQRQKVEERVEARRAEAEEQQRRQEEQDREQAKREAEHRKATEARSEAVGQVADAARRTARDVVNTASERAHDGAVALRQTSQKAAVGTAGVARRVREAAGETVTGYRDTVRESSEDVKAIAGAVRNFAQAGFELRKLMMNSVRQSARNQLDMARQVVREPLKFGQLQREYAVAASRNRIEMMAGLMQVVRNASSEARLPLDERLREVA
jgi:hypothetical protein